MSALLTAGFAANVRRYSVGDMIASAMVSLAPATYWWLRRSAWVGYSPLLIWDLGVRSEAILDEVQRRRWNHAVDGVARANIDAALELVASAERDELVTRQLAAELRARVEASMYRPGGYL